MSYRANALVNQMSENGYVVLDDFLTPQECDELIDAGLKLTQNLPDKDQRVIFSTTAQKQLKDSYFINSNDKICYFFEDGAIGPDGELKVSPEHSLNKVGHALHLLHPMFRCYTYCDRVKAVYKELGWSSPAVVQSMFIYKNPGIGGEVVPHQDATFLHTHPTPPVGFWIALDDATTENGCLWIAPGSHKSGVHRRLKRNESTDSDELLSFDRPCPIYPESIFTPVPVTKGTCILLHGNVVHKSDRNKSSKARPAYTFHAIEKFNNEYSADNWLQEGPNAPFANAYHTRQIESTGQQQPDYPEGSLEEMEELSD